MHKRFLSKRPESGLRKLVLSILLFIVVVCVFYHFTDLASEKTRENQKQTLETAIERSIVQCYAIEGSYPESLDYIKEHYGITYDENLFFVDYHPLGSDILPDVTIIER